MHENFQNGIYAHHRPSDFKIIGLSLQPTDHDLRLQQKRNKYHQFTQYQAITEMQIWAFLFQESIQLL